MRICYIADAPSIHTQRWVRYFADKGHEIHLISVKPFEGDFRGGEAGNVALYLLKRVPPRIRIISFLINTLFLIVQIRKIVRKIKPDILHAHYISDNGLLAAMSGFHPLVLSAWGSDILVDVHRSRILRYFAEFALKRADLITSSGENVMEEMIRLGADPNKINYILHGVDTGSFNPAERSEALRRSLGIFDSPAVISVRHLTPLYDVESLIKAIPLVLRQVPEVKFIIAGDGDQRGYLEELADLLGVADGVRFVGWIPHDELPNHLASADIYVSTSLSEGGVSVSLIEALACGLPSVVTNVGDFRKWIESGENGFVVPIKRADLLAEKIIYLLENRELRDQMGKANRQLIEERANYEQEMCKMAKLYGELIRRSKR